MCENHESVLTCLYWRFHQSPEEQRHKIWLSQRSCSLPLSPCSVLMLSLTICLKTLESLVLEKVLSGTQRGISPSLELALVRCILAIIAFSSFCSEGRTWKLDQLWLMKHNTADDNISDKIHWKRFNTHTRGAYSQFRSWKISSFTNLSTLVCFDGPLWFCFLHSHSYWPVPYHHQLKASGPHLVTHVLNYSFEVLLALIEELYSMFHICKLLHAVQEQLKKNLMISTSIFLELLDNRRRGCRAGSEQGQKIWYKPCIKSVIMENIIVYLPYIFFFLVVFAPKLQDKFLLCENLLGKKPVLCPH